MLVELTRELFHNWHRVRDGTIRRPTFLKHHRRLYAEFHDALDEGTRCADQAAAALCSNLFQGFENPWHFAHDPTMPIEPTNNAAERAPRHPVSCKQLSFGPQTTSGSRFVETLLSAVETCRQQGRDALQFLKDSLEQFVNCFSVVFDCCYFFMGIETQGGVERWRRRWGWICGFG